MKKTTVNKQDKAQAQLSVMANLLSKKANRTEDDIGNPLVKSENGSITFSEDKKLTIENKLAPPIERWEDEEPKKSKNTKPIK